MKQKQPQIFTSCGVADGLLLVTEKMLQFARNAHNQIACKSKQNRLIVSERIAPPFGFL